MALLPIILGADTPVLRAKTKKVEKVTKEILKLIADMEETVFAAPGAGLAAPQVGASLRVCLASMGTRMVPLINPDIFWKSTETDIEEEGCLSLPGDTYLVTRSKEIIVRYTDTKGKLQERKLKGWDARVVQHEVDHLDGILIVDYNQSSEDSLVRKS